MRRLLQQRFTPRAVAAYETFLRGLTARTLDAALAKGSFDFVREIAADFPINVLARMLGVPGHDTRRRIDWGNRLIGNTDPDYADVGSAPRRANATAIRPSAAPRRWRSSRTGGSWRRGARAPAATTS